MTEPHNNNLHEFKDLFFFISLANNKYRSGLILINRETVTDKILRLLST